MTETTQRWLTQHAARLIMLGLLTGGLVAAAMTGQVSADPHTVLASHLNAMLGAFWILGVAWSLPFVALQPRWLFTMAWCLLASQYGNWAVTAAKAFLHVSGVGMTDDLQNNSVFAVLNVVVVLPSFVAAGLWLWGLHAKAKAT